MHSEYVEQRNGGYYVKDTRLSLDSVVYSFNRGNSPESIQAEYPLLKQAEIYGATAFYLDRKADVDEYLAQSEREFEQGAIPLEQADSALWQKLERARARLGESRTRPSSSRRTPTLIKLSSAPSVTGNRALISGQLYSRLEGVGDPEVLARCSERAHPGHTRPADHARPLSCAVGVGGV